uniref:Uncharacterized protein n=1 Tax=Rhodnius prolixus TaxID=13249 RepID=T1IBZ6_RHOPR
MQVEFKCKEAEINRETMEKLSVYKEDVEKQLEEKYSSTVAALEEQLRIVQTEKEACKSKVLEDSKQSNDLRECFLLKQIELLSNRIEELYERGISHDSELDASRKMYEEQLRLMNESLKEMQPSRVMSQELKTLNEQLAESKTNELTLRAQMSSQEKAHENIIADLEEKLKLYTSKFSSLEQQYSEMLNEHEIHSRDQSLTIDNYFSTLNDVCKILNDLSNKVSELFVFLKNPNSNGSNSHSSAHLSVDWIIEKSDDISNVFTRVNSAILELEEIKAHLDSLRKENEVVFVENNSLRMKIDENKQCIKSLELELDELNKKYNDENVQRIELEEKYQVLSKEKDKIEDEIQQLETKCQKLLSDKVSLEKKVAEHNELYSNQMETILSQVNCWRNSQVFRLNDVEHTPTNNVNLIENPQNCDFLHVATSTPYPFNMYDLLGADENNKDTFQGDYYSHIALLKWMEKCQLLEQENSQLFIEVESLKSQVSELENSTHVAKNELLILEIKRQNLEKKISDQVEKKKKIMVLKEENLRHLGEITDLKEEIIRITEKNVLLHEENIKLEEKFQNYILPNSLIREHAKLEETFINDFKEKIKQIIALKGSVMHLQESKDSLNKQLARLNCSNNFFVIKLEQIFKQLCMKEDEMENLLKEKLQAQTENKLLTKEIESLKLQYDRLLKKLRNNHWQMNESPELLQHMQKVILNLSKSLTERNLEINKLKLEKNNGDVEELDARHPYEILLKRYITFQTEKESLLQKIVELQKLLHEFQHKQTFDPQRLIEMKEREQELLNEMKEHRNQYARIEEALRSTGKLHNELQQQKDELRFKIIEISKLEKKMQEEKFNLKKAELRNHDLLQMLEDKDNQIQNTIQEKKEMESDCKNMHQRLIELESKHASLEKKAEWRVARANLLLNENEVI